MSADRGSPREVIGEIGTSGHLIRRSSKPRNMGDAYRAGNEVGAPYLRNAGLSEAEISTGYHAYNIGFIHGAERATAHLARLAAAHPEGCASLGVGGGKDEPA